MLKKQPKVTKLLLILIFGISLLLRIVCLDRNPIELFGDEIDVGYQAYSLLKTGRDVKGHFLPAYLQSFSEWRAPLLMYATIPFIAVFGLNEWGIRLPNALFGSLTVLLLYFLVKKSGCREKTALLAAFLLAISPWHLHYSRTAFEVALLLFVIISGLVVYLLALERRSIKLTILAGLIFGLSVYVYNTANIFTPLLMLAASLSFAGLKRNKKIILTLFLVSFIVVLPMLYNIFFGFAAERYSKFTVINNQEITDKIQVKRSFYPTSAFTINRFFYNRPVQWLKKMAENYSIAFSPQFLFISGDITYRHSLHELGQLYWFQLPFLIIGFICLAKGYRKKQNIFWLLWLLIAPLPSATTIDGAHHATRLILMLPPLTVISAIGIIKVLGKLANKQAIKKVILLFFCLLAGFEICHFQTYYWNFYPFDSWRWWHYGYKEAMQKLSVLEPKYQRVLIDNTYEPALPRYLFWMAYPPKKVQTIKDQMEPKAVDGFTGFCLNEKVCFVDFGDIFLEEFLKPKTLYLISQERNVPGDWDWSENPPEKIKIIDSIRNPIKEPLFYLLSAADQSSR